MRSRNAGLAVCLAAILLVSCRDEKSDRGLPTAPSVPASVLAGATCATVTELHSLVDAVFGAGSPSANSAHGKVDNLAGHVAKGNLASAKDQAFNINEFVLGKYREAKSLPGTEANLVLLINNVFCYAGLTLTISDADNSWVVAPTDAPQTLVSNDGGAGVVLPTGSVREPTVITVSVIPDTFTTVGGGPLKTRLDQYPGYYEFTSGAPLARPVVVAVCPTGDIPESVGARLRLGHQAAAGFRIEPPADASFLTCSSPTASNSKMPGWLRALASIVVPKNLYASSSTSLLLGVGGTASEFSPFAPVDPELSLERGVGGTASEFLRTPTTVDSVVMSRSIGQLQMPSGSSALMALTSPNVASVGCTPLEAIAGTEVSAECRPKIVLRTRLGTVLGDVPVAWAIGDGGGTAAPWVASACGDFDSIASTTTGAANGKAVICWKLGSQPGPNTVTATPSAGQGLPADVRFSPSSYSFIAEAIKITPTAKATGGTVTYDGAAHPGAGSCSNDLVPALTYSPGGTAAPTDAGNYTLTVTCGANNAMYFTVKTTAPIAIARAAVTATAGGGTATYNNAKHTPSRCVVSGAYTGNLSCDNSPAAAGPDAGTTTITPVVTGTGASNFTVSSQSSSYVISPAAVTATAGSGSGTYNGAEHSPSACLLTGSYTGSLGCTNGPETVGPTVGPYTITPDVPGLSANFALTSVNGSYVISPAAVTATAGSGSAIYDGAEHSPSACLLSGSYTSGLSCASSPAMVGPGVITRTIAPAMTGLSANFTLTSVNGSYTIAQAPSTASVSCPVSVPYTGTARTPCTGSVNGNVLTLSPYPVTYSNNVVGTATATVSYAGSVNHLPSNATSTFKILYVQSGCFASPIQSVMPDSKSAQRKGSNLPIKCSLLTAQGTAVSGAWGDLLVEDVGTGPGVGTPKVVVNVLKAFKNGSGASYSYGLDTSPGGFISTHYYRVTANWSDGSSTIGYFYIR